MSTKSPQLICSSCNQTFTPDSRVETFNATENPKGVYCPACLKMQTQKRGSGRDEGQSHIQYGPCERCGSETQYFPLSYGGHTTYCPECERRYSTSSY